MTDETAGAARPGRGEGLVPAADGFLSPARVIMGVFFLQALILANWLPRIPDVEVALGLGHSELALALAGLPLGMFLGIGISGPLIEWLAPRRTILVSLSALCVSVAFPGWAPDTLLLFVSLFVMGASFALTDVAMNVEAARIETAFGRRIMSTCHGFWSIGSMVGSLMSGGIAELGFATGPHLVIVAVLSLPVGIFLARALPRLREVLGDAGGERHPAFALPSLSLLGLCFFVFGTVMVEQVSRNWGGVFLRDILGASPGVIGLSIGVFALFMAIGRFLGDPLSDRFGGAALARAFGILAIVGIVLTVTANGMVQALAGFIAMGLGVSVGFPLAIRAAASRTDRSPATNVAALAFFAYSSSLVGPIMVGFTAEEMGLRIGFSTILPVVVVSTALAGHLRRGQRGRAEAGP
ncbi:MAG: MFS transporter [Bauldia sp.]|nr:MFS transporter [Bauldia sp.]